MQWSCMDSLAAERSQFGRVYSCAAGKFAAHFTTPAMQLFAVQLSISVCVSHHH